jgi:phosphate transport system substrate-binding protein
MSYEDVAATDQRSRVGNRWRLAEVLCREIDIAGASRPINAAEIAQCGSAGVELIELPFGFDSLAVVANPANAFATCLTVGELKKIWEPSAERKVTSWRQIRSGFPDRPLALLGPGTASGTFDYFTLAVVGTQSSSRKDYTQSEDDTVLVDGASRPARMRWRTSVTPTMPRTGTN